MPSTNASAQARPDVLFFFSDQHDGRQAGYMPGSTVRTPNLDRLATDGTICETAYTACPLCVPARSAMLTGRLVSRIGIFGNGHILPSDHPTFLHAFAAAGYDTVLCGRMHFVGPDQRHGFTKRIRGDITATRAGGRFDRGEFATAFGMQGCADFAGAGDSPVLEYDRAVTAAALGYLAQDHDRPQCIVVGSYGPHFPYVAPPDAFALYDGCLAPPPSWDPEGRDPNPVNDAKRQRTRRPRGRGDAIPVTTDFMLAARAAYFGMITEQDRMVGLVRDAWQAYLDRTGRRGVFAYASDHGDTCGEHGIFGKQTFYEGSVRIPLVFEGSGVRSRARLRTPASILDIGPTLCELAGVEPPPAQDGISLVSGLAAGNENPERAVLSEWVQLFENRPVAGRMVRRGPWKLTRYAHERVSDQLFDIESDPDELHDCTAIRPDVHERLLCDLEGGWEPRAQTAWFEESHRRLAFIGCAERAAPPADPPGDQRPVPASVTRLPKALY